MGKEFLITVEGINAVPSNKSNKVDGILSLFPPCFRPYVEVTRFHKPAGLVGFYFPYLIGIFFAASPNGPLPLPSPAYLVRVTCVLLIDGLLLRSFGCAWNDTIDRDLDKQVARCKGRPVARGALSASSAVLVTFLLAAARHVLLILLLPIQATYHALLVTALAFFYPFAKRITNYPQVILGVAVGWAVIMVNSVMQAEHDPTVIHLHAFRESSGQHYKSVMALFIAQTLWNITYDTVYAFQDLNDDKKAGVKSMAVKFQHGAKLLLFTLIAAKVAFLFSAGYIASRTPFFFAGITAASVAALFMLFKLSIQEPKSCRWFFVTGQYAVSGSILAGLIGEYWAANNNYYYY